MASIYTAQPFSPDELRQMNKPDPQAAYAELAAQCPMHRGPDGTRTLMRMEDVVSVMRNPEVLGPGAHGPTMGGLRRLVPIDLDGPEHTRYRRLLDPLFSGKKMAALEPQVRALADELIDSFIEKKEVEAQAAFCQPLPSRFFLRLMGFPESDLELFLSFKNIILGHLPAAMPLPERMAAIRDASARCYTYLSRVLDEREAKGEPGDNLIGWLLTAELEGQRLTREQVLDIGYLMIIAGLDTVASSLVCMLARLARDEKLRNHLVAHPELWTSAIDELLRFETPVPRVPRVAPVDVQAGGETIPAGSFFFVSLAAANLDPAAFENPLELDPARKPNLHVTWGSGFHRCLGVQLAKMELRAALERWHARIPSYAIKPGHELQFTGMPRMVNALPLVW